MRTTQAASAEGGEGGGDMTVQSNRHSTLSLVMRKEEASQAEVKKGLICGAILYY